MKKIWLYHGHKEGDKHTVTGDYGIFWEPGEGDPSRLYDVHPTDEELKQRASDEDRPELDKDRKVQTRPRGIARRPEEAQIQSIIERRRNPRAESAVLKLEEVFGLGHKKNPILKPPKQVPKEKELRGGSR